MTAIAGFVHHDKSVWIGGDSAATIGGSQRQIRSDPKVFQRGDYVFGVAGSFRVMQLVRFSLQIPERQIFQDEFEYMATSFVDALRDCLKDGGAAKEVD